ncbi:EAL domain-containing protein [Bosea sp. RAC05]|uniref:EAL domain-containing protein n=1 Tax=Bosea sp. RAC05 TaxID=1842539 RepID=UPI00083D84B9|nr:EAL domain-containing protein [Bosea sp. RAC05]AOG05751.1 EAL domain protein [Bosea sp. RAC05]
MPEPDRASGRDEHAEDAIFTSARLYYQPQVSADGKVLIGLECLLRAVAPDGSISGPGAILDSIADDAQADALDWWVIRQALTDGLRWPQLPVAINISARQFQAPDFAARLLAVITEIGNAPEQVELELLESGIIENFDRAIETMDILRRSGVRIALDDFGTGYSSLAYLQKLPIDKLKLDKSLIDGTGELKAAAIVQAVTALSRSLGLKVVAEGVETVAQQQFLRVAGCHLLQGYLFSPAVSAERIDAFVRDGWPAVR